MEETKDKKQISLEELQRRIFNELTDDFVRPIRTWHRQKPSKRTAFLLFCDREVEEWCAFIIGNERAQYPTDTALAGLTELMREREDVLAYIRAAVRFVDREKKRAQEVSKLENTDYGTDQV